MLATCKIAYFQAIASQVEGHNWILVNNSFESLEKLLPNYQVSQPYLKQVQRYGLVKMAENHKKMQAYKGVSLQECVSPKPKTLES